MINTLASLLVLGSSITATHAHAIDLSRSSPLVPRQADFTPTGPFLGDFPDPGIIRTGDTWYAYSSFTEEPNVNIPVATSGDFRSWTRVEGTDTLPQLPAWVNASAQQVWAPDVAEWVSLNSRARRSIGQG